MKIADMSQRDTMKCLVFMRVAEALSEMATCHRRKVGCVLLDANWKIIGTGYNGVPSGMDHCSEGSLCPGAMAESGTNLDRCYSIHAENNALMQCHNTDDIRIAVCTTWPCARCLMTLMNTGCQTIIFRRAYPGMVDGMQLWDDHGRDVLQLPE